MPHQLRIASFIALLEEDGFLRKSIQGLKNDRPELYQAMKDYYTESESYHLLELLINKEAVLNEKYMIWVKNGQLPHIFEYKEKYSEVEIEIGIFAKKTQIPIQKFYDIAVACE